MDNKKHVGQRDRARVSANEGYEMRALAEKTHMPQKLVTNVTRQVGPMRKSVERKLGQMKRNAER